MHLPRSAWTRAVTASAALLAASALSYDARAYCREITQTQPSADDPAYTGVCFAGDGGSGVFDVYWKNQCVGYSIQKDASSQVTLKQATQVAAQAFGAWSATTCKGGGAPSIKAEAEDPVECATVQFNCDGPNQHAIIFRDSGWPYPNDPTRSLALTTVWYDTTDGEIFDADMEINSSDHIIVVDGPTPEATDAGADGGTAYDLLSIMTHEAGHFLGLAHSTHTDAVMYTFYHPGTTALTSDDVSGICAIYPPDGTRNTSGGPIPADACNDTPRHGFTSACGLGSTDIDCDLIEAGPGEAGESGGEPVVSPQASKGCSSSAVAPGLSTPLELCLLGLMGAGLVARRRRRRTGTAPFAAAALCMALTALAHDARASVSIAALFDELVQESRAVAMVTPVEQRSVWENDRIYTYTRMRVDARIAGELPPDPWVRTMGGEVGTVGMRAEGEAVFTLGEPSLLFLRPQVDPETRAPQSNFEVTARGQGQFLVTFGSDKKPRLAGVASVGALLPPSAGRRLHVAQPPRLARDVLPSRLVEDATKDIAAAWTRLHAQ